MNQMTPSELIAAVAHVRYELTQMVGAAIRVDGMDPATRSERYDDITNNALLESALLHVRSLIDFLTDSGRKTDVRASTFGTPPTLSANERKHLAQVKRDLDQHLAHITEARGRGRSRGRTSTLCERSSSSCGGTRRG